MIVGFYGIYVRDPEFCQKSLTDECDGAFGAGQYG